MLKTHAFRGWALFGCLLGVAVPTQGLANDLLQSHDRAFGLVEFKRDWVPSPQNSQWDGLGPLFNEPSCEDCHRGPALGGRFISSSSERIMAAGLVMRLGSPMGLDDPNYGEFIQTRAVQDVTPEARLHVRWLDREADRYTIDVELKRGPLADGILYAPIFAPTLVGKGVIDHVDPAAIEAQAAAQALRSDGISGMVRRIPDETGETIGRLGYKAEHKDHFHQISYAYSVDMGISSKLEPNEYGECTAAQLDCINAPHGADSWRGGVEITNREIETVVAYLLGLKAPSQEAPPATQNPDFVAANCSVCHSPTLRAKDGGEVVIYSDLLLHDMGEAFDNGIAIAGVRPSQWRTAPLLAMSPYSGRRYLHDGRAASIDTAILAHGGEAEASRLMYEALSAEARAELIAFIENL